MRGRSDGQEPERHLAAHQAQVRPGPIGDQPLVLVDGGRDERTVAFDEAPDGVERVADAVPLLLPALLAHAGLARTGGIGDEEEPELGGPVRADVPEPFRGVGPREMPRSSSQ